MLQWTRFLIYTRIINYKRYSEIAVVLKERLLKLIDCR